VITEAVLREIGISAAIFIILWLVLSRLFFKPFIELVEEREEKTVGTDQQARRTEDSNTELAAEIEEELSEARLEAVRQRDQLVAVANSEAGAATAKAFGQAKRQVETARLEIEKVKTQARVELAQEAEGIRQVLTKKLLEGHGEVKRTIH